MNIDLIYVTKEILKYRALTGSQLDDLTIIAGCMSQYNRLLSYGITADEVDKVGKLYAKGSFIEEAKK